MTGRGGGISEKTTRGKLGVRNQKKKSVKRKHFVAKHPGRRKRRSRGGVDPRRNWGLLGKGVPAGLSGSGMGRKGRGNKEGVFRGGRLR